MILEQFYLILHLGMIIGKEKFFRTKARAECAQYQKSIKNQIPPECVKILLREKLRSLCSCTTKYVLLGTKSCIKSEY